MSKHSAVRAAVVGTGGFGRYHIRHMLQQQDTTQITVVCEPSEEAYMQAAALFTAAGLQPPPNEPDFDTFLANHAASLDAALIVTPHARHHDQVKACLEAGLDVLVEKPMVMNAAEAESLIKTRDRTGKLLVVAFPGSLSPQIRTAVKMLRSGDLGKVLNISAVVWQNWHNYTDSWRGDPVLSGGGFLFDTGAHVLNTVADLAGEDFVEVAAWLDNYGKQVDILGAVMARLESGAFVTINASGATIPSCASDVRVFCSNGIIRTGMWGERLELQHNGDDDLKPVSVPESLGAWQQFIAVRRGAIANPCPPEVGLRMARLWDAINESARSSGVPVRAS
jgi:predicted dehydrogenase